MTSLLVILCGLIACNCKANWTLQLECQGWTFPSDAITNCFHHEGVNFTGRYTSTLQFTPLRDRHPSCLLLNATDCGVQYNVTFTFPRELSTCLGWITTAKDGIQSAPEVANPSAKQKGLSIFRATLFVLGDTAGAGVMALPAAIGATGWLAGIILIIVGGLASTFTSVLLGRCWLMIREAPQEEHKGHVRHPYGLIGRMTFGTPGRTTVSLIGSISLFSSTVVFLVMAFQNIENLLENIFDVQISFCYLQLILVAVLLPFTFLGTLKDMWVFGYGASLSTMLAVVLLMYVMVSDAQSVDSSTRPQTSTPKWLGVIQSIGVINFAYGSHSAFPAIQGDMKQPSRWSTVTYISFAVMTVMYTTVGLTGFFVYGSGVDGNVLLTATPGPVLYVVQILLTCHLTSGFVVVINPVAQEVEQVLRLPKEFSWRRVATRTAVVMTSLFLAESVPKFDSLVALVGATGATALAFVGPPLFYLRLRRSYADPLYSGPVPLHVKVTLMEISVISAVIGAFAAVSAVMALYAPGSLTLPCYLM